MEEFRQFTEGIEISNTGKVKKNGEIIEPRNDRGLLVFRSKGRDYSLPKAVLSVFNPVEGMEIRKAQKIINDTFNNNIENLKWSGDKWKRITPETPRVLNLEEDEVFKQVEELQNFYEISNYGNIRPSSLNTFNKAFYRKTSIYKRVVLPEGLSSNFCIPKLVLKYFKPEQKEENFFLFKDGNETNFYVDNLYWSIVNKHHSKKEEMVNLEGEEFKLIASFDNNLEVSNFGRVRRVQDKQPVYIKINDLGYKTINYRYNGCNKSQFVHRLVMLNFDYIPGCEKLLVNHKDGDPNNNFLNNLEWVTHVENMHHARLLKDTKYVGINKTKSDKFSAKLFVGYFDTPEEALEMLTKIRDTFGLHHKYSK